VAGRLWFATVAVAGLLAACGGQSDAVPSNLAGRWAATLVNYPAVGLYAGHYELTFGPGSEMQYVPPGSHRSRKECR